MLNMQANAAISEQQNCSKSMLKLAWDLKLDRWIVFDPLYTVSLTSFKSLYNWNFSNTQHHVVVKDRLLGLNSTKGGKTGKDKQFNAPSLLARTSWTSESSRHNADGNPGEASDGELHKRHEASA